MPRVPYGFERSYYTIPPIMIGNGLEINVVRSGGSDYQGEQQQDVTVEETYLKRRKKVFGT